MASPQIEEGYTKIANELLEKLYQFPMGNPHLRIVLWLIRFSYGFHEKMTPLNISRIARDTGMNRRNCQRDIRTLLAMNIIAVNDGEIGILKDWEGWVRQDDACVKATQGVRQGDAGGASRGPQNMRQGDAPLKKERNSLKENIKESLKKSGIPKEFPITEDRIFWVTKNFGDIPMATLEFQRDQFLDFFKGSGNTKKDWEATWRNWMRNWWNKYGGKDEVKTTETDDAEIWEEIHGEG